MVAMRGLDGRERNLFATAGLTWCIYQTVKDGRGAEKVVDDGDGATVMRW